MVQYIGSPGSRILFEMIYSGSKGDTVERLGTMKGLYNVGKANTNEGLTLEFSALLSFYCDNLSVIIWNQISLFH